MQDDVAICAAGIGKLYASSSTPRYVTLRETLTSSMKRLLPRSVGAANGVNSHAEIRECTVLGPSRCFF